MGRVHVLAVALALTACSRTPPTLFGERLPSSCRGLNASVECTGWVFDRMLRLMQTRYADARVAAYVDEIGRRVVRASGDRRTWRFIVLDGTEVQAFAGLGTTVYVHRGALAILRDEAELAAVLAHEVGHVLGNHARENFDEHRRTTVRDARDDELQADELAVLLLARAGYDTRGVERMLRAYAVTSPEDGRDPADQHPPWRERIARVQDLATAYPGGRRDAARFRARLATLVVGRDPRTVSLVGGAAVFAHAGFAVDLPGNQGVELGGSEVVLRLGGDHGVGLRVLDPALARMFPVRPGGDHTAADVVITERAALAIVAHGPRAAALVKQLRARVRSPRPPELASLHPTLADLDAPRMLWLP